MTTRQEARTVLAEHIERQGSEYRNCANTIRAGFENFWVRPALDAIEATLRRVPADDE